jgi:hypothetical protein
MRPFQKSRRLDTRLKQFAARSLRAARSGINPDRGPLMPGAFLLGGTPLAPSDALSEEPGRVVLKLAQLPAGPDSALARGPNPVSILCQPSQAEQI